METITSDIVIEILSGTRYVPDTANPGKGKDIRQLLEIQLGWTFVEEIGKVVNGTPTTVALYKRGRE